MAPVLSDKDVNAPVQSQDAIAANNGKPAGAKTLEYHRLLLQSKMAEEKYGANPTDTNANSTTTKSDTKTAPVAGNDAAPDSRVKNPQNRFLANVGPTNNRQQQYISPSDNIMSPCTAKLNALKGRAAGRMKPKSLFAQTSTKKLDGEKKLDGGNVFGAKNTPSPPPDTNGPDM
ncbi:uncharacterized protein F4822DRAFT_426950 [Hypoxylon trugodes]|uniref:uncharacterized protein n=1 Tax=Hypoxylon trugodes TaxID=326681 RepID=UPI002197E55E|nr:uncharacterized protein F4822DRAFT_426950 [Hypoxylon trugodes]KAI1391096.1 hypothetical protein F4822DRAFT_426950 [Hypoxylon trugodes]